MNTPQVGIGIDGAPNAEWVCFQTHGGITLKSINASLLPFSRVSLNTRWRV